MGVPGIRILQRSFIFWMMRRIILMMCRGGLKTIWMNWICMRCILLASALGNQGRTEEARKYCEDWEADEKDNPLAAAALIYAKIREKDFEGAEEVVRRYIAEDTECTEENDVIFTAALRLYKESGNKEMEKKIDDALEQYDKKLGEYLMGMDEEEFDFMDDELPFK